MRRFLQDDKKRPPALDAAPRRRQTLADSAPSAAAPWKRCSRPTNGSAGRPAAPPRQRREPLGNNPHLRGAARSYAITALYRPIEPDRTECEQKSAPPAPPLRRGWGGGRGRDQGQEAPCNDVCIPGRPASRLFIASPCLALPLAFLHRPNLFLTTLQARGCRGVWRVTPRDKVPAAGKKLGRGVHGAGSAQLMAPRRRAKWAKHRDGLDEHS